MHVQYIVFQKLRVWRFTPGAKGAYWLIVGNGMEVAGRDWGTAWLRPPSLGFQIYAIEAL